MVSRAKKRKIAEKQNFAFDCIRSFSRHSSKAYNVDCKEVFQLFATGAFPLVTHVDTGRTLFYSSFHSMSNKDKNDALVSTCVIKRKASNISI